MAKVEVRMAAAGTRCCANTMALKRGVAAGTVRDEHRVSRTRDGSRSLRLEHRRRLEKIGELLIEERDRPGREAARPPATLPAEQQLRCLLDLAPDPMIVISAEGKIILGNSRAERLFGYGSQDLRAQPVEALLVDRNRTTGVSVCPAGTHLALLGIRKDGTNFEAEVSLGPLPRSGVPWVCVAIRDVSDRKRPEEALAHRAAIVESAADAIISKDLDGVIRSWNPAAERMFGYRAQEVIGRNVRILIPPDRQDEAQAILERIGGGESIEPYETVRCRKDGSRIDVWLATSPLIDCDGRVIGATKIARDLTERKALERKLKEQAQTDPLTGAATRRHFRELAQRELARVRRHGGMISIVAIDVDRFKEINDAHGHAGGDGVLQALVRQSRAMLREEDIVGRLGGDEFALLLPDTDRLMAAKVAERLRNALAAIAVPADGDASILFTASIGVAASEGHDTEIGGILHRADKALYSAKRAGRNAVRIDGALSN